MLSMLILVLIIISDITITITTVIIIVIIITIFLGLGSACGLRRISMIGPRLSLRQLSGWFAPIKDSHLPQLWASAHLYFWASAPLVGFGSSIGLGLGSACPSYGDALLQ